MNVGVKRCNIWLFFSLLRNVKKAHKEYKKLYSSLEQLKCSNAKVQGLKKSIYEEFKFLKYHLDNVTPN